MADIDIDKRFDIHEIAKNKNIHITTDLESVIATVTPVHNVVPEAETETEDAAEEK
mgnify:CR=1 FL=1